MHKKARPSNFLAEECCKDGLDLSYRRIDYFSKKADYIIAIRVRNKKNMEIIFLHD